MYKPNDNYDTRQGNAQRSELSGLARILLVPVIVGTTLVGAINGCSGVSCPPNDASRQNTSEQYNVKVPDSVFDPSEKWQAYYDSLGKRPLTAEEREIVKKCKYASGEYKRALEGTINFFKGRGPFKNNNGILGDRDWLIIYYLDSYIKKGGRDHESLRDALHG